MVVKYWLVTSHKLYVSSSCNSKTKFHYELQNICIVNAIKSSKRSKNNLQNRSCKLDFPNISSLDDDLIEFSYLLFNILSSFKRLSAHPSFSTKAINSIKKQGKLREVFVLFTLQNSKVNRPDENTLKKSPKQESNP